MYRVVIDPGVLVSAAISPGGTCGKLLRAASDNRFTLILCPALLIELYDVLVRPKFRRYLTIDQALQFVAAVQQIGGNHPDPDDSPRLTSDPDDDYLIALSRDSHADALVSGDPHLTSLEISDPSIYTPSRFLELLSSSQDIA